MGEYGAALQSPTVAPGRIWVIEHDPASELPVGHREALGDANAVLYDRSLAALVANVLPLGGYAEPLAAEALARVPAASARAIELAAEGWSVVQLVAASESRGARLHAVQPGTSAAARAAPSSPAFTANGLAG